jgi:SAM-dependent methyltransferase
MSQGTSERFMTALEKQANIDPDTVEGFGEEWTAFDQSVLPENELRELFSQYFRRFPWTDLPTNAEGFDLGCGSGRWAKFVAPKVGTLHCIDASAAALDVAKRNLREERNCEFHLSSVSQTPLNDGSMDFGYSLGVLHHIPDTQAGMMACVAKLKPGAPFLVYLYYAFDNRPSWFRILWRLTDAARRVMARLPFRLRYWLSQIIATVVYFPLARLACLLERIGLPVEGLPLSAYRRRSYYTMRTDSLDRFGTKVEHRFTQREIRMMMEAAGLERVSFSDEPPYWCAVGYKRRI